MGCGSVRGVYESLGMSQNFLSCDRGQGMLLPPDFSEWLPAGHLAWFVIAVVDQLDLSVVYGYYRRDGRGRPAHDPAMMVALLLYAYAIGVTSSRAIERRCVDDVAFRVISANRLPDHATIARFLVRHRRAIQGLFFEVLALCRRSGMVSVGTVAVDSTKLAANASAAQNRTLEGLEAEARRIVEEAIETDRREDQLYGDRRGDELPQELADPRTRKDRIKELLEQARREQAAAEAARAQQIASHQPDAVSGKRARGRSPKPEGGRRQRAVFAKKYNLTDPDSGVVRHRGMLLQGYNVQLAASEDQVILAVRGSGVSPDGGQLEAMVEAAQRNLERIGVKDRVEQVLADTGYWDARQIKTLRTRGIRALIPPANRKRGKYASPEVALMHQHLADPDVARQYRRRKQIIEPVFARTKHHRGITRLLRRGKPAVQAEIDLIATTHNLLKLKTALATA